VHHPSFVRKTGLPDFSWHKQTKKRKNIPK
jgi:hypothetical protein